MGIALTSFHKKLTLSKFFPCNGDSSFSGVDWGFAAGFFPCNGDSSQVQPTLTTLEVDFSPVMGIAPVYTTGLCSYKYFSPVIGIALMV